jgi:RNA-directed DNA polymerase
VAEVDKQLFRRHREVVDADLADYFGSIPHAELLQSVARRIVDRRVLRLIKMWLDCPVEETDDRKRKTRTMKPGTGGEAFRRTHPSHRCWRISTCAGSCWDGGSSGWSKALGTRIVTYADDLVILCRTGRAEEALQRLREIMGKLKLTVIEEKTRICRVAEGAFDSL